MIVERYSRGAGSLHLITISINTCMTFSVLYLAYIYKYLFDIQILISYIIESVPAKSPHESGCEQHLDWFCLWPYWKLYRKPYFWVISSSPINSSFKKDTTFSLNSSSATIHYSPHNIQKSFRYSSFISSICLKNQSTSSSIIPIVWLYLQIT